MVADSTRQETRELREDGVANLAARDRVRFSTTQEMVKIKAARKLSESLHFFQVPAGREDVELYEYIIRAGLDGSQFFTKS